MNLIIQGPQGSGKGTQAELLQKQYGFHYFDTGKILRSIAASENDHAAVVKAAMDKGELVPDEYLRLIAWDYISKHEKEAGFIFDGYPRSLAQYEHLKDMLMKFGKKIDHVINIEIPEAETISRLSSRRVCTKCGEIYNLVSKPPKSVEACDVCGGELIQRADDTSEAIRRRLQIYREQTHPVFDRAAQEGIAIEIDGSRSIEAIHQDIVSKLYDKA